MNVFKVIIFLQGLFVSGISLSSDLAFAQHGNREHGEISESGQDCSDMGNCEGGAKVNTSLKLTCSNEKECGRNVKLKDGTVVGAVVGRRLKSPDIVEKYVKDKWSKLTWSPAAPEPMTWEKAKAYCEEKKDLGLKWNLPTKEDYRFAFNPKNPDGNELNFSNMRLLEALELEQLAAWSATDSQFSVAWAFFGNVGINYYRTHPYTVRCVGRRN